MTAGDLGDDWADNVGDGGGRGSVKPRRQLRGHGTGSRSPRPRVAACALPLAPAGAPVLALAPMAAAACVARTEEELVQGCRVELVSGDICEVFEHRPGHWPIGVTIAGCGDQYVCKEDVVLEQSSLFGLPGVSSGFQFQL